MIEFSAGFGLGLLVGGGAVYYFYAKLKASIGAVTTTASTIKKDL